MISHVVSCRCACYRSAALFWTIAAACYATLASAAPLQRCSPADAGLDGAHLERIDAIVAAQIEQKKLPGCVVVIGRRGKIAFERAYGHRRLQPTAELMTLDTVFDMASLTKPTATATSIMLLVERGQVRLRDPVATYLPEFAPHGKSKVTVEDLLTHQGGLIPDNPLADYQDGVELAWQRIWNLQLRSPVGEKFIYTDVGFLVLGELVHRVSGQNAAEFAAENIFKPIGMEDSGFQPDASRQARAATTEQRNGEWLRGVVHDPRAALLEGIAGHAGLFSTAEDMARYADMMLSRGMSGDRQVLSATTVDEMTTARDVAGHRRGLGWDMRSKYSSNRSELMSERAFGHGGFTGTAMWIDPQLDLFVIFLSNRVHPDGKGSVNSLAGRIGTIATAALSSAPSDGGVKTASHAVLTGIDVTQRDGYRQLADTRVGLITNHTGVNRVGERTIDLLHQAENVDLVCLFSPEHGLQGKLDQANISDMRDEATDLPIYSLYGKTRTPNAGQLSEVDTLVFDIQDIGARFYTYLSTMGNAMEAAAERGLKFVVLDRPNPIGGVLVEGPVRDADGRSFVGHHDIPVRHGMTLGELAEMICRERDLDLKLKIVRVENWRRGDYWDATGLTWINPSPNMRSLAQAVLYPGIGLLETTNLSVGRGTDTPFELFGAPWIDGLTLASALNDLHLPGVRFIPIRFTPDASKFANQLCGGVNATVIDRAVFRPVEAGLQIAATIRRLYPHDWETKQFNRLLISKKIFEAVTDGKAGSFQPLYRDDLRQFLDRREPFLLYR
ncbi:MAG: exo-beta-N-acetylmuramidase NamZ domain-containing protein [Planctomycetota bacterium]